MNESKISVRYSRALFQSALEKNILDTIHGDMLYVAALCRISEVKEVLSSPIIVPSKKKTILGGLLSGKVDRLTLSLIDLLVKNGREKSLADIARVFTDEYLRYKGLTVAHLTTAIQVDKDIKTKVTELIKSVFGTGVEIRESVEPEIIGGFVLKVNDSYLDASVRNKLRKIKKGLSVRSGVKEE
ncbi:MAG: ATP synthase F1 subunit delta [Bacteroidales bacterium]